MANEGDAYEVYKAGIHGLNRCPPDWVRMIMESVVRGSLLKGN